MQLLRCVLLLVLSCLSLSGAGTGKSGLEQADAFELRGDFNAVKSVLQKILTEQTTPPAERGAAEFALDRLDRIEKDFPFTADALFEKLKTAVKDLTREEYMTWIEQGRFDSRVINGDRRFMVSSVANLFFRYPELNPRRLPPRDTTALQREHLRVARDIRNAAIEAKKPYVLPKRFSVSMTVSAQADAGPANELVRAWLPIPRTYPFQQNFRLAQSQPPVKEIAPEDSTIRSAYFEQTSTNGKPATFKIDYEYTASGVWFNPSPEQVKAGSLTDDLRPYLREEPHVVFTPEMRQLLKKIVGEERNPCRAAKQIYDWISSNIKYSYAIEYSTIRNISEYCRERGYGDCGQEALLLITLCRLQGIPARWQSGWSTFPGSKTIHDWAEIYLQPYGWMPVDVYMGIYAQRYANALTPSEKDELRDFYFGGLDQYRLIANSAHSQPLTPAKKSFRSDTVDFQRGELDWGDRNIYFDKFSYELQAREIAEP